MKELTYERNHEPHQQGEWFDYTGFRFKDWYDIQLKNSKIIEMCRPNADAWYSYNGKAFNDKQVDKVRLKPDSELDPEWHHVGEDRIKQNIDMFSSD